MVSAESISEDPLQELLQYITDYIDNNNSIMID